MSGAGFEFLAQPMTIAALTVMRPAEWAPLSINDMDASADELGRAARAWLWLCDVAPGSPEAERVRLECLDDAPLICALHLPAPEFVHWFKCEAWGDFDSTERTGSEGWAVAVLVRAWGRCEALGALAAFACGGGYPSPTIVESVAGSD